MTNRIIDPAAGRGVFFEAILDGGEIGPEQLFGVEIDARLAPGKTGRLGAVHFHIGDGLLDEFPGIGAGQFDLAIGNPPFGRLGDILPAAVARDGWDRFTCWQQGMKGRCENARERRLSRFPIEVFFIERALQLVRPEGLVALVLPDGTLANMRRQNTRDWIRERALVAGVVSLPGEVFCRAGLNARTSVLFLRRKLGEKKRKSVVPLMRPRGKVELESYLRTVTRAMGRAGRAGDSREIVAVRVPEKRLAGNRWDPGFWHGREFVSRLSQLWPVALLGDYIQHLTYGPIVTGRRPRNVREGIRVIRQGDFAETGIADQALRVRVGSVFDPLRSRVQKRDLLLPRSGAGALGRNRMAVYTEEEPANVGCFVDLVRLAGINPFYVWFFFKSEPGRRQILTLINGVGTPNINFAEIRSLRIPLLPEAEQTVLEERYWREVWPLHRRREAAPEMGREGERCFRKIVGDLERFLTGEGRSATACSRLGSWLHSD